MQSLRGAAPRTWFYRLFANVICLGKATKYIAGCGGFLVMAGFSVELNLRDTWNSFLFISPALHFSSYFSVF